MSILRGKADINDDNGLIFTDALKLLAHLRCYRDAPVDWGGQTVNQIAGDLSHLGDLPKLKQTGLCVRVRHQNIWNF